MVSFQDLTAHPQTYRSCVQIGIRRHFRVSGHVFLDNGAYAAMRAKAKSSVNEYVAFVRRARPQWFPIPGEQLPLPSLSRETHRRYFHHNYLMNRRYGQLGFVPVIHAGPFLSDHFRLLMATMDLPRVAIGGLVPYFRYIERTTRQDLAIALSTIRSHYRGRVHIFGIGGLLTLHLAAAIRAHSIDSVGWQIRAANGVVLLPEEAGQLTMRTRHRTALPKRIVTALKACSCPGCLAGGYGGLFLSGAQGFKNRALHNLSILLREKKAIEHHAADGSIRSWSQARLHQSPHSNLVTLLWSALD